MRKVALKLMRLGGDDVESAQRFCREGATLARLDHPGIAKVHAAGVAETPLGNLPYFAMEFVDGVNLLEHVDQEPTGHAGAIAAYGFDLRCGTTRSSTRRRTPRPEAGNIPVDGEGQPRVLDFGIARLIDEAEGGTRLTQIGELVGTLPYMSPEQLHGDPAAVDTRADATR